MPTEIKQSYLSAFFTRRNYRAYLTLISKVAVALAVVFALAGLALNLGWAWALFGVTLAIAGCALIASAIMGS